MLSVVEHQDMIPVSSEAAKVIEIPSDIEREQIINIFAQVYPNYPLDANGIRDFISLLYVKTVCVKNQQGEIVGVGFLEVETESNGYGSITGVAVLPEHRGNKYGIQINAYLLKLAKQSGLKFLQSDPVLNFQGLTDNEGKLIEGGGNDPNLANLKITLTKNKFAVTGFSLGGFQDISRPLGNPGEQDTSVVRSCKVLDSTEIKVFNTRYQIAAKELQQYWDTDLILPEKYTLGSLKPENIRSSNNGRIKIATSTNIRDFREASFLPTYFLPCYTKENETLYIGVCYEQGIRTRTSGQEGENIFDLDIDAIATILGDQNQTILLTQIVGAITRNYKDQIHYSESEIKLRNL